MDLRQAVLLSLASVPLSACPSTWNCDSDLEKFSLEQILSVEELNELVGEEVDPQDPWKTLDCETVCHVRYERTWGYESNLDIDSCELNVPNIENIDNDDELHGKLKCSGSVIYYCKGRRPLGHIEASDRQCSDALGRSLSAMAYLEAASVIAFEQLAIQLECWRAPRSVVQRCRAAANDERRHAGWMRVLAHRRGAIVPPLALDPCNGKPDLFSVARHNAIEGCINESYSALLAAFFSQRAQLKVLRPVFARLASDELRHGQLAWDIHDWLRNQLEKEQAQQIDADQRESLHRLTSKDATIWTSQLPSELGPPSYPQAQVLAKTFTDALKVHQVVQPTP